MHIAAYDEPEQFARGTKMIKHDRFLILLGVAMLSGCASSGFVSSWKAIDATPLEFRGAKVAAMVMMRDEESRRAAEDTLAKEITARGAQGVPMYTLLPSASPSDQALAREALEKAGVQGAVVMRPVSVEKEVSSTPETYLDPKYSGMWGGYYEYGWNSSWGTPMVTGGEVHVDQIVSVETLVYSLKQNKLVWSGQSRTTNPEGVNELVKQLSAEAAAELEKQGLIRR
jgi:hypothetical protein